MKKINLIFLFVWVFASALNLFGKTDYVTKKDIIEGMKKANNFVGYKGNVYIEVMFHDENYSGIKGMEKNVGRKYKAYFDLIDYRKQKILFYADKDIKELEISLINGKYKVIYDKKDITKNIEKYENELSKYPYIFFILSYYEYDYLFDYVDITQYIDLVQEGSEPFEDEDVYFIDLSDAYGGAEASINVSKDFRMLGLYVGDDGYSYKWGKVAPKSIFVSTMAEGIIAEFLDLDGWVKK